MINYTDIESKCLDGMREQMQQTPQDSKYHGEGDVMTHTQMVLDALDVSGLTEQQTAELRIAALMHDIGKVRTTQVAGDDIICPNHSVVGARMTREILWKQFGLAGTPETLNFRETVCALVRYHGLPPHVLEDEYALAKIYRAASVNLLGATDFTMDLLFRLAKADMMGRICKDQDDALAAVDCFLDIVDEEDIRYNAPVFMDMYSTHQFLNFKTGSCKEPKLYDDTKSEVMMLCGLPGTGKDTYIKQSAYHNWPIISLDDVRKELRMKPGETNGAVIQTAKNIAKEYLRKNISFVWNATNLTPQRKQLIDLFETYHAAVRIEYLETTPDKQDSRNHNREEVVPQNAVDEMIGKLVLPEWHEAQFVSWKCI